MGDCGCSGSIKPNVVGKTETDAINILKSQNMKFRISSRDGELYVLTMELNPFRANLDIENGIVIKQTWG